MHVTEEELVRANGGLSTSHRHEGSGGCFVVCTHR